MAYERVKPTYSVLIGFVDTKQSINYDLTLHIFPKLIIHVGGIWVFPVSFTQPMLHARSSTDHPSYIMPAIQCR